MPTTIVFANQKGGVSKTTTAASFAARLHGQGRRVLCVDADPQANLSASVGAEGGGSAFTCPSSSVTPAEAASCCNSCSVFASKHSTSSGTNVKPVHGSVLPSLAVPSISVARYFLERVFMLSLIYGYGEPEPG